MNSVRRDCICGLGGLAVGGALLGLGGAAANAAGQAQQAVGRFGQVGGAFGWTPHKLDPKECATVAYEGYWHRGFGCAFGTFYGIVGLMGEKYGAPYNQFPFAMLEANKGGISDWGTICGALYGAAASFSLFWSHKEVHPMVNELFRWYEVTKLPVFNPGDAAQGFRGEQPMSSPDSVLCHISVSKWCYENKIEAHSRQRSERCGRLTADTAFRAAEIINAKIEQGEDFKGAFPVQKSVVHCGECPVARDDSANSDKGVMDRTPVTAARPPRRSRL